MKRLFDDIYTWSFYSHLKGMDFNGYLLHGEAETVLIDPPEMSEEDLRFAGSCRPPFHILVTNKDHRRKTEEYRTRFEARVWIHQYDAPLLGCPCDETFRDGDPLPGGLRAVHIPDNKSPGETGFLSPHHGGLLFLGDALVGKVPGELRLMQAAAYPDVPRARQGLRVLLDLEFNSVLVGDGTPILQGGKEAVRRYLE